MKKLVFFISFFIYSGYYAGLAIIFSLKMDELSRFYTIPLRIIVVLVMLYIIRKNWRNLLAHKLSIYIFLFVVFWIFYILKVLYTENVSFGNQLNNSWFEYIFFALTYVVVPFIAFLSVDFKAYKNVILDAMIFSGFVMGIVSTYIYGALLITGVGRLSMLTYETGENVLSPLALSYAGALTIVLCIHRLVVIKETSKYQKLYLYATIVFAFVMFLLGSSRGSVIALMLTLPLFILYSPLKQKISLIVLTIISTPIVIWAIEASGSNIFERIGNTKEDQGSGRQDLWINAFDHFVEYPLIGGRIELDYIYPHNLILEILMSTGIIGFFLIIPVIFKGFKLSFFHTKNDRQNLFVLLIIIQGFIQHFFSAGIYTSTILFVPIALVFSLANNND
ncbi:O-antigen ligase family protein [Flagellimonas flava]|uniref:O-antigen ligase like membrane protein n=1 Tax=Flagellimonas flava TaxID=570519 RepID=A0A1M5J683_9FLAO|nr:O-antigen ligase family protein [Allomuricauda flava]SHG36097.1 O-antigen ligase like membrane protein [Allomuricauda flava]